MDKIGLAFVSVLSLMALTAGMFAWAAAPSLLSGLTPDGVLLAATTSGSIIAAAVIARLTPEWTRSHHGRQNRRAAASSIRTVVPLLEATSEILREGGDIIVGSKFNAAVRALTICNSALDTFAPKDIDGADEWSNLVLAKFTIQSVAAAFERIDQNQPSLSEASAVQVADFVDKQITDLKNYASGFDGR